MIDERMAPRGIMVFLLALALALCAPATALENVPQQVQPGERIEVGSEPLVLDFINLRNQSTFNPITELRYYRDDNTEKQIVRIIGVPNDGYVTINSYTLGGKYGRYFPFSAKDGLIQQHSIVFVAAQTPMATQTETPAATTATTMETPTATTAATPTPTQAALPGLIPIAALGICGLLAVVLRR